MEKRRRKPRADDSVSLDGSSELCSGITFETFFSKCVLEGKLKSWQRLEIAAFFFRDMKLRDKENLEVYEATLGKY